MKQFDLRLEQVTYDYYKLYICPNKWFSILLFPFAPVSCTNLMRDPWVLVYTTDDCIKAFEYIEQITDTYTFKRNGKKYIEINNQYFELKEQKSPYNVNLSAWESSLTTLLLVALDAILGGGITLMAKLFIPLFLINFWIVYSNRHILGTQLVSKKRRYYTQKGRLTPIGYFISDYPTDFTITKPEEEGNEVIWQGRG